MGKHLDKIIYILVLLVCCYFGYQTRVASVIAQNNYISEFEKNLELEKEEGKPFSVSLKTIGVLYVPDIKLTLAVFNNAGEAAISHGCGLIQGTGTLENNHDNSVVTSHNGDPSSDLFINLPKIKVGNKFYIKMKDGKIYEYEVIDTREVSPIDEHKQFLTPEGDLTYVTLRTCTPVGINDKRFLATGKLVGEVSTIPTSSGVIISVFEWGLIGISLVSLVLLVRSVRQDRKERGVPVDAKETVN